MPYLSLNLSTRFSHVYEPHIYPGVIDFQPFLFTATILLKTLCRSSQTNSNSYVQNPTLQTIISGLRPSSFVRAAGQCHGIRPATESLAKQKPCCVTLYVIYRSLQSSLRHVKCRTSDPAEAFLRHSICDTSHSHPASDTTSSAVSLTQLNALLRQSMICDMSLPSSLRYHVECRVSDPAEVLLRHSICDVSHSHPASETTSSAVSEPAEAASLYMCYKSLPSSLKYHVKCSLWPS